MHHDCGTLLDDPLSAEHHIILVQGTNLKRPLQRFCKGRQKVAGASEDQVINMHTDIAVDSLIPVRTAGNRINDVVHDRVHIAFHVEIDHKGPDLLRPILNLLLHVTPVLVANILHLYHLVGIDVHGLAHDHSLPCR